MLRLTLFGVAVTLQIAFERSKIFQARTLRYHDQITDLPFTVTDTLLKESP